MTGFDGWEIVGGVEDGIAMEMGSGKGKGDEEEGEGERDDTSYSSSMDGDEQILRMIF